MSLDISTFKHLGSLQNLSALKRRRHYWLTVHIWLGLALGALLSIYGVTGSILVFHAEINELLNPTLLTVAVPKTATDYKPLAELFQAGKRAMPETAVHTFSNYPRNSEAALRMSFTQPSAEGISENWAVYVNPYTAEVTGKRLMSTSDSPFPRTFIGFVFTLHYALLLPKEISTVIVGVSGALLIISTLTGLIVWWPLTGKWRQAMGFKVGASAVRFNYDLHKTSGFYTALVMIPVLFSGVYMVLPESVVPVLELFSPVTYRYWFGSKPQDKPPITMAEAVAIADRRYPEGRPDWIYGISSPASTYTVCKDGVQAAGSFIHRRCVVIDQYSGAILDVDDPSDRSATAGEVFTHWQWPLHSGQAFGWTGRILVFTTGLACPVLFVTGFIRWRQKQRARQKAG